MVPGSAEDMRDQKTIEPALATLDWKIYNLNPTIG